MDLSTALREANQQRESIVAKWLKYEEERDRQDREVRVHSGSILAGLLQSICSGIILSACLYTGCCCRR